MLLPITQQDFNYYKYSFYSCKCKDIRCNEKAQNEFFFFTLELEALMKNKLPNTSDGLRKGYHNYYNVMSKYPQITETHIICYMCNVFKFILGDNIEEYNCPQIGDIWVCSNCKKGERGPFIIINTPDNAPFSCLIGTSISITKSINPNDDLEQKPLPSFKTYTYIKSHNLIEN